MAELRWDPLLRTWVIFASHRQARPLLPQEQCPFCPGSGRVPEDYDIYAYDNDFPSLMLEPPEPDIIGDELVAVEPGFGKCEVTLYSPDHDITLPELPLEHVVKLVDHWEERYRELGAIPGIEYVFIFENRGEVVGVTITHPHGQIYAYPFIPLRIKAELDSTLAHWRERNRCLICDLREHESSTESRIVYEHAGWTAFVPPFAQYPYEVFVVPQRHFGSIPEMSGEEKLGLAMAVKCVTGGYDDLFGIPFPYMMCMHQDPTDGGKYPHYHFHIEFYPPMRSRDTLKYNASSETGAWAHINPTSPEEKAGELRERIGKRLDKLNEPR